VIELMEGRTAPYPTVETERLILRAFTPADAPEVQRLAGEREIAATTATIPHPYEDGMAEKWIRTHEAAFQEGTGVVFAVTRRLDGGLVGAIGLTIQREHRRAELGYWIGKPYWNQGYATEAARAVLRHGFEQVGLRRIYARHFGNNPASGRVLVKVGMKYEGCLREHFRKWGVFQHVILYGISRNEYQGGGTDGR